MKEPKLKTVYVCSNCGETSPRWMGRCPSCGSWNTMNEDVVAEAPKAGLSGGKAAAPVRQEGVTSLTARRLADISTTEEKSRILTGISELDRVLGGGIVLGGVVLLSGEPGVGKSTMLLQLCGAISNQHTVLYITGEESVRQVKLRAARLKVPQDNIYLAAENDVDEICGLIEKEKPELVVIDSIQTMRCMDISSSSGTVSQVKESAAACWPSPRSRRSRCLSWAMSTRTVLSQARRSWSTSWIRFFTLRETKCCHTASCGRLKIAMAPPTSLVCLI